MKKQDEMHARLNELKERLSRPELNPKNFKHFSATNGGTGFTKAADAMGAAGDILDELEPWGKDANEPLTIKAGQFFDMLEGLQAIETERLTLKGLTDEITEAFERYEPLTEGE